MIKLNKSWLDILEQELEKDYMKDIKSFLKKEIESWKVIYPHPKDIFNALNSLDFQDVKVVILGQDPYHWEWQAHGLSFSVREWVKVPPSLRNIYKEIESDLWIVKDKTYWNLEKWTKDWVLLLNAALTVEAWKPASHSKIWWHDFTDTIIKSISDKREWVVFLLWGAFAQSKLDLIDSSKHLILQSSHPSPFSSHRWFFGCKHFSKANEYLIKNNIKQINW